MTKKIITMLQLKDDDVVLHVGPRDGYLLELIHSLVKECHAVERSRIVVKKLTSRFHRIPNILVQEVRSMNLPYPRGYFTKVVFDELGVYAHSELEIRTLLDELRRVSSDQVLMFIGGVPMDQEESIRRRMEEGPASWWERLWVGTQAIFRAPEETEPPLVISEDQFRSICRQYGLHAEPMRIEITHAFSTQHNDFLVSFAEQPTKQFPIHTAGGSHATTGS